MVKKVVFCMALGFFSFSSMADSWAEKIALKGDFRYRYEMIKSGDNDARNRQRLRARVGVNGTVNDYSKVTVQLATGSDDPISTNQTLGDAFTTKDMRLDLAYFTLSPVKGLDFMGGKMKNPFETVQKSELLWDPDLNPEGLAVKYLQKFGNLEPRVNAGAFWVEERSADPETYLFAGQAGFKYYVGDMHFILGGGYYDYDHIQGQAALYEDDGFGNTMTAANEFTNDYNVLEGYFEYGIKAGNLPLAIIATAGYNLAVDSSNLGYIAGFSLGKAKDPRSWHLRALWREMPADAVFATFTDSDFGGGGTDSRGAEVNADYQVLKHFTAGITYFYNWKSLADDDSEVYQRMQADLKFKF